MPEQYRRAATNTTADITAKSAYSNRNPANKIYDGNTSASVTISLVAWSVAIRSRVRFGNVRQQERRYRQDSHTIGTVSLAGADAGTTPSCGTQYPRPISRLKRLQLPDTAANKIYDGNTSASVTISLGGRGRWRYGYGFGFGNVRQQERRYRQDSHYRHRIAGGADAGNYTVGAAPNTTADITAKALTATEPRPTRSTMATRRPA